MPKKKPVIGIYKITNIKENKSYIGKSKDIDRRINNHFSLYRKGSPLIHEAIEKYEVDDFVIEILINCDISELDVYEKLFIEKHNTIFPCGYNCNSGGAFPVNDILYDIERMGPEIKSERIYTLHKKEIRFMSEQGKEIFKVIGRGSNNNNSKKVKDNIGRVWGCIADCAKELKIKNLSAMLRGVEKYTKQMEYYGIKYANEDDIVTEFPKYTILINPEERNKSIIDNTGRMFRTIQQCFEYFGINNNILLKQLCGVEHSYKFLKEIELRYMTIEEKLKYKDILYKDFVHKGDNIIDKDGNIFSNILSCAKYYGIDGGFLKKVLRGEVFMPQHIRELKLKKYESF